MYLAIRKTLYARSLFRNSSSNCVKHATTVKRLLEFKRTFSRTTSVAEEADTAKGSHIQDAKEHKASSVTQEQTGEEPTAPNTDPDTRLQPKLNPWMDFFRQYLSKHREPGVTSATFASDASRIWRSMSAEEKAAYGDPEAEVRAYNEYIKKVPKSDWVKDKASSHKKARTTLPKLTAREVAMRAENLFIRENYDKNSPLPIFERGAELSKRWNALGEEEREVYKQRVLEMYKATGS